MPFNLINEPWLPIRRRSGLVESIQPWRITEHMHEDPCVAFAWPRPDFNGAAHEFLIGLLSTAAPPESETEWEAHWQQPPQPAALLEHFRRIAHAFNLDGPGPRFMQDLDDLADGADKGVSALLIDSPGAQTLKHNADLFVKRGGTSVLGRPAAAMALYTLCSYAPSGGTGHRTSLRGGGPMTTLIVADHPEYHRTLWGRLWPNVESREQLRERSDQETVDRADNLVFPWLADTRTSDAKSHGRETTPVDVHPLQVYWGMPRRIRLVFEDSLDRACDLTGFNDSVVTGGYRTKNYGINYSSGFEHPLTPYYRQKAKPAIALPVHPQPGSISYRSWPGLVIRSKDGLREPARAVRHWMQGRRVPARNTLTTRFVAFGYDMDNMKARAWTEGEMPLWQLDGETHQQVAAFIGQITTAAGTAGRLLSNAVKTALHNRPKDARGDYSFISERLFRDTEPEFYLALGNALEMLARSPDADDPAEGARRDWAPVLERVVLGLFDEFASLDGLEDRAMHRHVKARFQLAIALRGHGKTGQALFEGDLGIARPLSARARKRKQEAA